jgi:predicted nucleic acid-binding protein
MSVSIVIDASVVLKLFGLADERFQAQADALQAAWWAGELEWHAPKFLELEVLNSLGRRHRLPEAGLRVALQSLNDFSIRLHEPDLEHVAHWVGRGLTSCDATYIALAEQRGLACVTDDVPLVNAAPEIAVALSAVSSVLIT